MSFINIQNQSANTNIEEDAQDKTNEININIADQYLNIENDSQVKEEQTEYLQGGQDVAYFQNDKSNEEEIMNEANIKDNSIEEQQQEEEEVKQENEQEDRDIFEDQNEDQKEEEEEEKDMEAKFAAHGQYLNSQEGKSIVEDLTIIEQQNQNRLNTIDDSIQELADLNEAILQPIVKVKNENEDIIQGNEEFKVNSDSQEQPPEHILIESKSLTDLKVDLNEIQQGNQEKGKKVQKPKKKPKEKKIMSPQELNDFLKKHKLISSSSLSDSSFQESQIKSKNPLKKQTKAVQRVTNNKTINGTQQSRPIDLPQNRVQPKQQIYRFCRDPRMNKNNNKITPKKKYFSLLDLDLFKYKIIHILSFLSDKDILKLRQVHRTLLPCIKQFYSDAKKVALEKLLFQKKLQSFEIKEKIYKNSFFEQKIESLTSLVNQNISHVHLYLYFDKLDITTLKVNECKLIKIFYEVLKSKTCIINSIQILNYCASRKEDKTLFAELHLSYNFMNEVLQQQFYSEIQVIIDFLKINNSAIIPSILETQIFCLKPCLIEKIEKNIFIEKTYSSKILKGIYHWLELQLFYNQYLNQEAAIQEMYNLQEQCNFLKHQYEINSYLINKSV